MSKIEIDLEKCIGCGKCINDCITYSLEFDENRKAKVAENGESLCISCQHCFSICPVGAIKFNDKNPEEAPATREINPQDILDLIKSRRSIRQFKKEEISHVDFEKLKGMLPYIPTGCNYNGLHFSIIESRSAMDDIRNFVNTQVLKLISNKFTEKYVGKFKRFKKAFEKGEDIIFRNAPHMIVVSSDIKAPCANVDPIIALSYIELYAKSLGLGTCWCGFAQACFKLLPKLSKMVEIPDGYKPVYVMLIGIPDVEYPRVPLPEDFSISEINELKRFNFSIVENIKRLFFNFIR